MSDSTRKSVEDQQDRMLRRVVWAAATLGYRAIMIDSRTVHVILPITERDFERCCPAWAKSPNTGFGPTTVQTYWISVGEVNAVGITDLCHIIDNVENQVAQLGPEPTVDDFIQAVDTTPDSDHIPVNKVFTPTWQMKNFIQAHISSLLNASPFNK